MAQFNGKQEGRPLKADLTCAAPATVSGRIHQDSAPITATERLEQALGKATEVVSASPDTGQQGGGASKNAPLNRSSTVGEGGEST